jgi:hypothetical protein
MSVTPGEIVRLVYDHNAVGLVREVDGELAAVVFGGPGRERGQWIPFALIEPLAISRVANISQSPKLL